jgi:hypothetical protein
MYEDEDEDFLNDEEIKEIHKRTGFCGLISEIKKRPDKKLFPSIDDMI